MPKGGRSRPGQHAHVQDLIPAQEWGAGPVTVRTVPRHRLLLWLLRTASDPHASPFAHAPPGVLPQFIWPSNTVHSDQTGLLSVILTFFLHSSFCSYHTDLQLGRKPFWFAHLTLLLWSYPNSSLCLVFFSCSPCLSLVMKLFTFRRPGQSCQAAAIPTRQVSDSPLTVGCWL